MQTELKMVIVVVDKVLFDKLSLTESIRHIYEIE